MSGGPLQTALGQLRRLTEAGPAEGLSDADLLARFTARRDEAAFEALVRRHGPLVLGVCRLLGQEQDAEDAFQATFLVLARKADAIRQQGALASWLHRVACRLARRVRAEAARRRRQEREVGTMRATTTAPGPAGDLRAVLDEEVQRLSWAYRAPVLLCYLEGLSHTEAARQLGWPVGTVKGRLARARQQLGQRLSRRGVDLSASALAATVPTGLVTSTVKNALAFVAGTIPGSAAALAEAALGEVVATKFKLGAALVLLMGVLAGGFTLAALPARTANESPAVAVDQPQRGKEKSPRADLHGDPLPPAALVRLGTVRLRGRDSLLAFSADGKQLLTGSIDYRIQFWDTRTGKALRQLPVRWVDRCAALSPDGTLLALGEDVEPETKSSISLWDVTTGEKRGQFSVKSLLALAFSPDGKALASATRGGLVQVWDATTGKEKRQLPRHASDVRAVLFTPDGKALISAVGGAIHFWDLATGREVRKIAGQRYDAEYLAISPDGRAVTTGGWREVGNTARSRFALWDVATGKLLREMGGHPIEKGAFYNSPVAFSPDGKTLAAAWRGSVWLWDVATGKELRRISDNTLPLRRLAFSPDGRTLAAAGPAAVILLWEVATGKPRHRFAGHEEEVSKVAFSPDGKWVVTGCSRLGESGDNTVRLWNAATGQLLRELRGHGHWISKAVFTPDGSGIVSGSADGTARLWDARTGKEVCTYQVREDRPRFELGWVRDLALSPDGKKLTLVSVDTIEDSLAKSLSVWDVATGKQLTKRPLASPFANAVEADHDGNPPPVLSLDAEVVAEMTGRAILLRETATTRQVVRLEPPPELKKVEWMRQAALAFSPDGQTLAARTDISAPAQRGCGIRLWELATGETIFRIPMGENYFGSVAFSPDGRALAAAGYAGFIGVWDVATGKELLAIRGPENSSGVVAFAPDGQRLAVGNEDSSVLIWDVARAVRRAGLPPRELRAEDLDRLWADLAGADARRAHTAIWTLVSSPDRAVSHLKKLLRPARGVSTRQVEKLIADLDHAEFAVRDAASRELEKLGELAEPALRKTLDAKPALEVRRRIEALLARPRPLLPPESLRTVRAIGVLEQVGSKAAQEVLQSLAAGAPAARPTREARAALERLAKRRDARH